MTHFVAPNGKSQPAPWKPADVLAEVARRFHADRVSADVPDDAPELWATFAEVRARDSRLQLILAVAVASAPAGLDDEAIEFYHMDAHPGAARIGTRVYSVSFPVGRQEAEAARLTITTARGRIHPHSDPSGRHTRTGA